MIVNLASGVPREFSVVQKTRLFDQKLSRLLSRVETTPLKWFSVCNREITEKPLRYQTGITRGLLISNNTCARLFHSFPHLHSFPFYFHRQNFCSNSLGSKYWDFILGSGGKKRSQYAPRTLWTQYRKKTAERVHYHLTINCDVFPESITMDSLKNVGLKFIRGKKTFQRMKITAKCPLKRHVPPADSLMIRDNDSYTGPYSTVYRDTDNIINGIESRWSGIRNAICKI